MCALQSRCGRAIHHLYLSIWALAFAEGISQGCGSEAMSLSSAEGLKRVWRENIPPKLRKPVEAALLVPLPLHPFLLLSSKSIILFSSLLFSSLLFCLSLFSLYRSPYHIHKHKHKHIHTYSLSHTITHQHAHTPTYSQKLSLFHTHTHLHIHTLETDPSPSALTAAQAPLPAKTHSRMGGLF
jgi:hypothetical protein